MTGAPATGRRSSMSSRRRSRPWAWQFAQSCWPGPAPAPGWPTLPTTSGDSSGSRAASPTDAALRGPVCPNRRNGEQKSPADEAIYARITPFQPSNADTDLPQLLSPGWSRFASVCWIPDGDLAFAPRGTAIAADSIQQSVWIVAGLMVSERVLSIDDALPATVCLSECQHSTCITMVRSGNLYLSC